MSRTAIRCKRIRTTHFRKTTLRSRRNPCIPHVLELRAREAPEPPKSTAIAAHNARSVGN